jgi:putative transposase
VKHDETQIAEILAQAASGEMPIVRVCRLNGISEQTFYRWRRTYSGSAPAAIKRLRGLEAENERLKRLLAERDLEIDALRGGMPSA